MLESSHLFLFFVCLLTIAVLLGMLIPIRLEANPKTKGKKQKPKGYCPLCGHTLYSGEKVHSSQVEIGNVEVQTRIKGCIHCIDPKSNLARTCPICKKKVSHNASVLASSNPRIDRLKLNIKGCKQCFPQGFL